MLRDLLSTAAVKLRMGGRLVFWMPSTVEYCERDVPHHPCFRLVSNSLQQITLRWGRRLLTMEKCVEYDPNLHANLAVLVPGSAHDSSFFEYVFSPDEHPTEAAAASATGMDPRMLERLKQKARKKAAVLEKRKQEKQQRQADSKQPPKDDGDAPPQQQEQK